MSLSIFAAIVGGSAAAGLVLIAALLAGAWWWKQGKCQRNREVVEENEEDRDGDKVINLKIFRITP